MFKLYSARFGYLVISHDDHGNPVYSWTSNAFNATEVHMDAVDSTIEHVHSNTQCDDLDVDFE